VFDDVRRLGGGEAFSLFLVGGRYLLLPFLLRDLRNQSEKRKRPVARKSRKRRKIDPSLLATTSSSITKT